MMFKGYQTRNKNNRIHKLVSTNEIVDATVSFTCILPAVFLVRLNQIMLLLQCKITSCSLFVKLESWMFFFARNVKLHKTT